MSDKFLFYERPRPRDGGCKPRGLRGTDDPKAPELGHSIPPLKGGPHVIADNMMVYLSSGRPPHAILGRAKHWWKRMSEEDGRLVAFDMMKAATIRLLITDSF